MTARNPEAGFTLIEALVAMAVLALGAVSLLTATEGHAARITAVTDRTLARWAADQALTAARLGLPEEATLPIMGRDFPVKVSRRPTDDPNLTAITVDVVAPPGDSASGTLYRVTGYTVTGFNGEARE
ncbi:general secretion pathway protein I [Loktanella atrilutea]|uniref:Type II secretion system protein I n=1 Tax=Loktanella atrilutea TaxID=366533 RepID=A0A1M5G0L4_LOKAT|nr:type II secretion system minor pseudopilin GspI [Loktanella atrilutea]SHF96972.1 general secretion pathway protein I [Loktanella atrilutea]